jgi:hypothetical protein
LCAALARAIPPQARAGVNFFSYPSAKKDQKVFVLFLFSLFSFLEEVRAL